MLSTKKFDLFVEYHWQLPLTLQICRLESFDSLLTFKALPVTPHELEKITQFNDSAFLERFEISKNEALTEIEANFLNSEDQLLPKYIFLLQTKLKTALRHLELIKHIQSLINAEIEVPQPFPLAYHEFLVWHTVFNFYVTLGKCYSTYRKFNVFLQEKKDFIREYKEGEILSEKGQGDNIGKKAKLMKLTAFEVALRHWYLVKAGVEKYIIPKAVGEQYREIGNYKNIEQSYSQIDSKPQKRQPTKKNLEAVREFLTDYPTIQKAIINDIERLS